MKNYKYLSKIDSPLDLKALDESIMGELSEEIRDFLISCVTKNGGHLASNLGVVELTMAIHRVFDTPHDHLIFDVGHQSYVHKILTGRRALMETLRQAGGATGFTNRDESEHDCFGAGHSSTSLSAALGFAVADKLSGSDAYTVAVVGDGAYTGGMIHEALNNCRKDLKLVIIINENEMSISKNIGRFATSLSRLRIKSGYFKTKRLTGAFLKRIPLVGKHIFKAVRTTKQFFKNALYGSNYFEGMGLTYLGPVDGNDYGATVELLREAKKLGESVIVHVKTTKGKGFEPAEAFPDLYHGVSPNGGIPKKRNFSVELGEHLSSLAKSDSAICAITAAMCDGTGLNPFKKAFPDRFFDVGIAEEHAVTFAAGLAASGKKPFVCLYSTFLQRAYDNVIHDVALQDLPVTLCVDRAGLNAFDGATHHGIFDVAFLSQIPNMTLYTPATTDTLHLALQKATESKSPVAIRYPNGHADERVIKEFYSSGTPTELSAKSNFKKEDAPEVIFVAHGRMMSRVLDVAEILRNEHQIKVGCILLEVLKPYSASAETLASLLPEGKAKIIFAEEEIRSGGMGVSLYDKLINMQAMIDKSVQIVATDDNFAIATKDMSVFDAAGVSTSCLVNAALK